MTTIFKSEKPLFILESLMLMFNKKKPAFKVNRFRKRARLAKMLFYVEK